MLLSVSLSWVEIADPSVCFFFPKLIVCLHWSELKRKLTWSECMGFCDHTDAQKRTCIEGLYFLSVAPHFTPMVVVEEL